jgi:hypothetical protein
VSNRHHIRADKVVVEFKEIIGESVCSQISAAHFQDLALLVRDAITDEVLAAAERMEKVIKEIRSETDLHELGI